MEELKKTIIEMGEKIPCNDSAVIAEGDVIVPDIKPDVKKIMSADAKAVVKKSEFLGNVLKVSGTIFINILYLAETAEEEKEKICAINTRFDFADEIKLSGGENINAVANACVRHIDFSLVNSRKLNLKIYVGLSVCAYEKKMIEFLDEEENSCLEVKKNKNRLYSVIDETTREVIVSENIALPQSKADIGEILKVELTALGGECKLLTNKILVKGILNVNMLYISADSDEDLESLDVEIPFSDVFDVEGIKEDSLCNVNFGIKDYYYNVKNDINDNPRNVAFEALVDVYISVGEIIETEIAEDCYIPGKNSVAKRQSFTGYEIKEDKDRRVNIKERMESHNGPVTEVCSCLVKPVILEQIIKEGTVIVKGLAICSVVAKTNDDAVVFDVKEAPFEYSLDAGELTDNSIFESDICVLSKNYNLSGGDVEVNATFGLHTKILCPVSFDAVTECSIVETENEEKPAMLVIYFVQKGDEMWDVAKKYKTTPLKIRLANNLDEKDKICAGMKLLIPTV